MKRVISSGFAGFVFGLGLLLSGMTRPSKVIGFLDLAGSWDPSLMFVMAGGIAANLVLYRWAMTRSDAFLGEPLCVPAASPVDAKLVCGAGIFGVGWGLGGYCPGPAIVSLATGKTSFVFVCGMVMGMLVYMGGMRIVRIKDGTRPVTGGAGKGTGGRPCVDE